MTPIVSALLACWCCFVCTSCSDDGPQLTDDGRIIIQYWEKWTGFEGDAIQAVVDDFNASQDRVFVKRLTVSQIDQKLLLATAGGNPPDVAGLWSHSVNVFAEKGALTPLDHRMERAGVSQADYIPVFWKLCEHRGFMWALPSTPATVALHWNKALFREAGLDPDAPPRSIADLEAMSDQLTVVRIEREGEPVELRYTDLTEQEKEAKQFDLLRVGHLPNVPGWFSDMWCFWFGSKLVEGDRRITAAREKNITTLKWYRQSVEKFGLDNVQRFGAGFGNAASPQSPFLSGKVAMVLQGVWMYNFIEKFAPHIEWGAAPFPSFDAEQLPGVTIAECDVLVIPRGSAHPEEAFEFIRYVNSRSAMEKLCLGQRKFTPLKDVSPDFLAAHPNPYIKTFIDLARSPNVRHVPRLSVWNQYKTEMQVALEQVHSLRASPDEALRAVERRVQFSLDRVMARWDRVKDQRLAQWAERNAE